MDIIRVQSDNDNICNFCNKEFSNKVNLIRHRYHNFKKR